MQRFAPLVRQRLLFAAREATGRHYLGWYVPRNRTALVGIRHATGDLFVLKEIFGDRLYEPPRPVADVLDTRSKLRILDLGGHIGLFGLFALERWPHSTVTSFEPDRANRRILEQARTANGFESRWTVQSSCAGTSAGVAVFSSLGDSTSHVAIGHEEGLQLPVADVFPDLRSSDLAKIDIEGSEWAILADPRFTADAPPVIVIEYHSGDGERNAGAARKRAADLLGAAQYAVEDAVPPSEAAGVLWAWKSPVGDQRP